MSLGEVHWLPAYARQDRAVYDPEHPLVCNCGLAIKDCPFWSRVEELLARPLADLQVHTRWSSNTNSEESQLGRRLLLSLAVRVPSVLGLKSVLRTLAGKNLASDCIRLFGAVAEAAGRNICVDSSKSAIRFRAIYETEPSKTRAIVLTRDARAVVYSKMKRGRSLAAAADGWRRKMQLIESLTAGIPREHVHVLKYEDLCEDTESELSKICMFLGVENSEAMLRRPTENLHNIGGSPSKFDKERISIALDRTFETGLCPEDMREVLRVVGTTAARWGY